MIKRDSTLFCNQLCPSPWHQDLQEKIDMMSHHWNCCWFDIKNPTFVTSRGVPPSTSTPPLSLIPHGASTPSLYRSIVITCPIGTLCWCIMWCGEYMAPIFFFLLFCHCQVDVSMPRKGGGEPSFKALLYADKKTIRSWMHWNAQLLLNLIRRRAHIRGPPWRRRRLFRPCPN